MTIRITHKTTSETYEISRDVCTEHPQWVHAQLGTGSESELQSALDALNVEDWYRGDTHLGPDVCGLEMYRDVA